LAEATESQPRNPNQPLSSLHSTHNSLRLVPSLLIAQHASSGKAKRLFLRGFNAGFLAHRRLYVTRRGDFTSAGAAKFTTKSSLNHS
jgi:hypothetical protein